MGETSSLKASSVADGRRTKSIVSAHSLACGEIAQKGRDESAVGAAFVKRHQGGARRFIIDGPEVCPSQPTLCEKTKEPHLKLSTPRRMTGARKSRDPLPPAGACQEESPTTPYMRVSLVQGSVRCDHLHIAAGHEARDSFSQSETSGVTIERETTVWLMEEAREHPRRLRY